MPLPDVLEVARKQIVIIDVVHYCFYVRQIHSSCLAKIQLNIDQRDSIVKEYKTVHTSKGSTIYTLVVLG